MLEQESDDCWRVADMEKPYGRGINFQMEVPDVDKVYRGVKSSGIKLFREMQEGWYDVGDCLAGQNEFLIQDPDGYLLRFVQDLGEKKKD